MLPDFSLPSLEYILSHGYGAIFLLTFGESLAFVGLFVPGTIGVLAAGALIPNGFYDFWTLLLYASIGAILGDAVSYEIGRRGKGFLMHHPWLWSKVQMVEPYFKKHGTMSIVVGRFFGQIRSIIPVVAGIAHMHRGYFYLANILSAVVWCFSYLSLGFLFGEAWKAGVRDFLFAFFQ